MILFIMKFPIIFLSISLFDVYRKHKAHRTFKNNRNNNKPNKTPCFENLKPKTRYNSN